MKSIAIVGGDIALSLSRRMDFVRGKDKLLQDLRLWLSEPIGTGISSPRFGSTLYSMVGDVDPEMLAGRVTTEVRRVLGLYQQTQVQALKRARQEGTLGSWHKSEILQEVVDVKTVAQYDRIKVTVTLRTLSSTLGDITLSLDATLGGVQ